MAYKLVGVRFVELVSRAFASKSTKTYDYQIEEDNIEPMIGKIIKLANYSNYIVVVDIKDVSSPPSFGTPSLYKTISKDDVSVYGSYNAFDWKKDSYTDNTIQLIRNLVESSAKDITKIDKIVVHEVAGAQQWLRDFEHEKENNKMMTLPNMTFGPYTQKNVGLSFYGLAVQNPDSKRWFAYKKGESYDVTDFLMQGMPNAIFAMPVAIKKIAEGDIIMHNGLPMVVQDASDTRMVEAIDISNSELKLILPAKSPFGFNFYTKLVSLFDGGMFGGMFGDEDEDKYDGDMFENPMMMMMMLMNGGENNNLFGGDSNNFMTQMMAMKMMGKMFKD